MKLTERDIENVKPYLETFATRFYKQLEYIPTDDVPIIFYSTGELTEPESNRQRYVEINDLYETIIKPDIAKLYSKEKNETIDKIFEYTQKVVSDASKVIHRCSSMFIMIEGDFQKTSEKLMRKKIYNHYHPARYGKDSCEVLSYLQLCEKNESAVTESFIYHDFHSVGYYPPKWYDMNIEARALELKKGETLNLKPCFKKLPEKKCLRIEFDATRWYHGIDHLTKNTWIMTVFNDVEFKTKVEYGPPKFSEVDL
jgi:hypothetical protein